MALGLGRALERVERRVEAGGEPGELVLAVDLEPLGEVGVGRERLGAAGEARHRRKRGARHHAAEHAASTMPAPPTSEQDEQELPQRLVDLRQRPRGLYGARGPGADGEHAQVRAATCASLKWLPLPLAAIALRPARPPASASWRVGVTTTLGETNWQRALRPAERVGERVVVVSGSPPLGAPPVPPAGRRCPAGCRRSA